jgi:hypothetical protein
MTGKLQATYCLFPACLHLICYQFTTYLLRRNIEKLFLGLKARMKENLPEKMMVYVLL